MILARRMLARRIMAQRLLAVVPLALLPVHVAARSTWYAVRGPGKVFIVDMPAEPTYKVLDTQSPAGTVFATHSYSLDFGGLSFVAQAATLPADIDVRQPRAWLQAVLDERAQRLAGGRWSRVDWLELQGAPVADATGSLAGGNLLRQLVLLRGRSTVSLACLGPAGQMRSPTVDRFFASLRLG